MDDIQKIEHYVLSIISMLIVAIMSIGLVIQSSFYFGISWFGIMMTLCSCCIILDANTTLRSLCCSLFSIGAIIPIFVANCWWGAAVIPVAIVFWGIKRRSIRIAIMVVAYFVTLFLSLFTPNTNRLESILFSIILIAFYVLWEVGLLIASLFKSSNEKLKKALVSSALDSLYERKLRQRLAIQQQISQRNVRLEERERISLDIHNSVGHTLSAASVALDAASVLASQDIDKAMEKIDQANTRVHEAISSIRSAVRTLDSEEDLVFVDDYLRSLRELTKNFTLDTEVLVRDNFNQIDDKGTITIGLAAFLRNATSEMLTNGVKHGGATSFDILLKFDSSNLSLQIRDNGFGWGEVTYDKRQERIRNGYGLRKMNEYVDMAGGNMTFSGSESFEVEITLPRGENKV